MVKSVEMYCMNCVKNSVGDHEENYDVLLVTNMIVVMDHFDHLEA